MIVYISIGNSDDKLTQAQWAQFIGEVDASVRFHSGGKVHGAWLSAPASPWQNACWCVEYADLGTWPTQVEEQKRWLGRVAHRFDQDSIAWAEVSRTEFLEPVTS